VETSRKRADAKHLLTYFGDYALSEIVPAIIQGFLAEKTKTEISWYTVRNLRTLLSRSFAKCRRVGISRRKSSRFVMAAEFLRDFW
jgi:hypothetical protein